jgi:hypothetical protein
MTETTKLFELAQLAEASYAFLENVGDSKINLKNALVALDDNGDYKFSPTQAAEFADNWRVVSHQPNTASGFASGIFS